MSSIKSSVFDETPTALLVLHCVRADSKDDLKTFLNAAGQNNLKIDWASIFNYSWRLKPFFTSQLLRHRNNLPIPRKIVSQFEFYYLSVSNRNRMIKKEILDLATLCQTSNIPLVFLKGSALLLTVYKCDDGARMMEDVDVLARKEDLPKIEALLIQLGYREDYQRFSAEFYNNICHPKDFFLECHNHIIYYKDNLRLELHWDIQHQSPPGFLKKLWTCLESAPQNAPQIKILNAPAVICNVCLNYDKDFSVLFGTIWMNDPVLRERVYYYTLFFLAELKAISNYYASSEAWIDFPELLRLSNKEFDTLSLLFLAKKIINAKLPDGVFRTNRHDFYFFLFMIYCHFIPDIAVCRLIRIREIFRACIDLNRHPKRLPGALYRKLIINLVIRLTRKSKQ